MLSLHLLELLFELVIDWTGPWIQEQNSEHGDRRNGSLAYLVVLERLRDEVVQWMPNPNGKLEQGPALRDSQRWRRIVDRVSIRQLWLCESTTRSTRAACRYHCPQRGATGTDYALHIAVRAFYLILAAISLACMVTFGTVTRQLSPECSRDTLRYDYSLSSGCRHTTVSASISFQLFRSGNVLDVQITFSDRTHRKRTPKMF